jgi:uncharacterized protein (DUF1501 family)
MMVLIPLSRPKTIFISGKENIGIQDSLPLTDEAGINPSLPYFKELFDSGELSVMNNVGYPNPDKSHFRSMDIWQSASRSDEFLDTGWLGRFWMRNVTVVIILPRHLKWMICSVLP